jgi:hypothetical protein
VIWEREGEFVRTEKKYIFKIIFIHVSLEFSYWLN